MSYKSDEAINLGGKALVQSMVTILWSYFSPSEKCMISFDGFAGQGGPVGLELPQGKPKDPTQGPDCYLNYTSLKDPSQGLLAPLQVPIPPPLEPLTKGPDRRAKPNDPTEGHNQRLQPKGPTKAPNRRAKHRSFLI